MSNEPRDPSRIPIPGGSRAPYQPGDPRSGHRGGCGVDPSSQGDGLGIVNGKQTVRLDPRSFLRFLWTGEITAQLGKGLEAVPGSPCELQVRLAPGFKFNKDGQIAPSQSTSVRVDGDELIATPSTEQVTDETDGTAAAALGRIGNELAALDTRLDAEEAATAALVAADSALDTRVDSEEAATVAIDARLDVLEARSGLSVCFHAVASSQTAWANMPLADTLLFGSHRHIRKLNLTGFTSVRLLVNKQGTAALAGAKLALRYRTDAAGYSTTVGDYATIGASAVECAVDSTDTYVDSGWIALAAGAKADVFLSIVGYGGDGVVDPQFGGIDAEFR